MAWVKARVGAAKEIVREVCALWFFSPKERGSCSRARESGKKRMMSGGFRRENQNLGAAALCCWLETQKEDGGTMWRLSGEDAGELKWQGMWELKIQAGEAGGQLGRDRF